MLLCPAQDPHPSTSSAFDIQPPSTLPWSDDPGSPGAWILLLMNHQVNSLKLCYNAWSPSPHFISSHGHLTMSNHKNSACMLSHFSRIWLCNSTDCSPPGSSVHGILQARILEWVAMSSSRGSSWPRDQTQTLISPALAGGFFTTSTTFKYSTIKNLRERDHIHITFITARQAPLSMESSKQEYCSWWPSASPGNLLDIGIEPGSP